MSDYLHIMKTHSDNLEQAGSPVSQRALVSQVILGLDEEYNLIVATIQSRMDVKWTDLQSKLLIYEKTLEHHNISKTTSFGGSTLVNMTRSKNFNPSGRQK